MQVATQRPTIALEGELAPHLSRWLWLVKWILAIPHFVVLIFLWVAFVVLTGEQRAQLETVELRAELLDARRDLGFDGVVGLLAP